MYKLAESAAMGQLALMVLPPGFLQIFSKITYLKGQ
jgi:hypothetical protein